MKDVPKFLLGWWFNKPILMNHNFETITKEGHYVPNEARYDRKITVTNPNPNYIFGLGGPTVNDAETSINPDGIKMGQFSIDPSKVKIKGVDGQGKLHLEIELTPEEYESRQMWGKFTDCIQKWKSSIDFRKVSKL